MAAANRELMEECGFGAHRLEPLVELTLAPNYMCHRMQVMLATDLYPRRLPGDEPEPLIVETHAIDEIGSLLARDDFHEARAIAALFIARDKMRAESTTPACGRARQADSPFPWACSNRRRTPLPSLSLTQRPCR